MRLPFLFPLVLCVSMGSASASSPCEAARQAHEQLRAQQTRKDEQFVAKRAALQARIKQEGDAARVERIRAELRTAEAAYSAQLAQLEDRLTALESTARACRDDALDDVVCTRTVCR